MQLQSYWPLLSEMQEEVKVALAVSFFWVVEASTFALLEEGVA